MTPLRHAPFIAALVSGWVLAGVWAVGPAQAAGDDPGHALAEKFASEPEREAKRRKAEDDNRRRADEEAEMLSKARAEAEQRKAAADKARAEAEARDRKEAEEQRLAAERAEQERAERARRLAEDQRIAREKFIAERTAEAERRLADERRAAEDKRVADEQRLAAERRAAEDKRVADEQRAAEERRVAELKAAEEKRIADERRVTEDKRIADERRAAEERRVVEQKAAEEKRIADDQRAAEERRVAEQKAAEEKRVAEEARMRALEAEREGEHRRLTDRLKTMERERMTLGAPPAASTHLTQEGRPASRVTVLLVMNSGSNGIRRFGKKTADPVICSGKTCWISAGSDVTSKAVSRGLALGPGNTLGHRAAACNQHLECAFRDIDVSAITAPVQPIDLRIMRHDRREPLKLEADPTCRFSSGVLSCGKTFSTRTWRAWAVPEHVAREAGVTAIEAALASGLSLQPSAALDIR